MSLWALIPLALLVLVVAREILTFDFRADDDWDWGTIADTWDDPDPDPRDEELPGWALAALQEIERL